MRKTTQVKAENQTIFVGLEDSKRTWKLHIRCNNRIIDRVSLPAHFDELIHYFRNHYSSCSIKVIYEAGFSGFWLHDKLQAAGISCVVTPPHTVTEAKRSRVKTDAKDAGRLAKILETGDYTSCSVPSRSRRDARQVSRTLIQVQKKISSTMNQMRKFFDFHGLNGGFKSGAWGLSEYKRAMSMELDGYLNVSWSCLVRMLKFLQNEKKVLKQVLLKMSKKEEYTESVRIYSSVPGIGWFTAIRLALEWGDLSRFRTGEQFASFLGLVASEFSTGDSIHRGRITGMGNGYVRHWLVECAWRAVGKDPALRIKFERVWASSGSKKKAIVAVARKLAVRLRAISISAQPYELGVLQ